MKEPTKVYIKVRYVKIWVFPNLTYLTFIFKLKKFVLLLT